MQPTTIRPLQSADAPALLRWLTDPLVLEFYEGRDSAVTSQWIEEKFYQSDDPVFRCVIEYDGSPAGYLQYYPVDAEGREEYGYEGDAQNPWAMDQFIGEPQLWGKGIGRAFVSQMLRRLQQERGADAVLLDPKADNIRAIRCYEACGFQRLKLLPAHEFHEGAYRDCWLMEWRPSAG